MGPRDARARAVARQSQLYSRLRGALARRRQASDAGVSPRPLSAFTTTSRSVRRSATGCARDLKLSNAERERITLAGRFSSVPGRGQEAPRVEAQADPGGARDRRAAGASSRRRAGIDGQYRARRLLRVLFESRAGRPDQSPAADHGPRPGAARPQAGVAISPTILEQVRRSAARGPDPDQASGARVG